MILNKALRGHGTFCYLPDETMNAYAASAVLIPDNLKATKRAYRFAHTAKQMGFSHVWVRLFGLEGPMPAGPTKELLTGLREVGIEVAGWGYCHGRDAKKELQMAADEADRHELVAFVADIEPGRELGGTKSQWGTTEFGDFVDGLVEKFGQQNLGMSTWPVLRIQNDQAYPSLSLMRQAAGRVGVFAPQAYWMNYPKQVHYRSTGLKEAEYPRNDPASFVRLVIDAWKADGFDQPLLITGQAYWGEGAPPASTMEKKMQLFSQSFADWPKIVGFNWWHAGGSKTMSSTMIQALKDAKLDTKPFATAEA